jgi:hypothetical protein
VKVYKLETEGNYHILVVNEGDKVWDL